MKMSAFSGHMQFPPPFLGGGGGGHQQFQHPLTNLPEVLNACFAKCCISLVTMYFAKLTTVFLII